MLGKALIRVLAAGMVGVSVGPYRILERLGIGGQGEVYLAEDTRLGRKVALRSLTESWTQSPHARNRLLLEARVAAQLSHPQIAAIYDVLEAGDQAHIVMEYVEGETLAARLKAGPLPVESVIRIGIQIAEALSEAHAHGVIHRDLKPGNVVVTKSGKVKVLDFGLAKQPPPAQGSQPSAKSEAPTSLTAAGMIVGTPAYMSPEQLLGQTVDARSDIYGLGVVLFELLTGRKPFAAPSGMGLAMAILTERPPGAAAVNPEVPPDLSEIVARAMARDAGKRYQSANELCTDLRQLLPSTKASGDGALSMSRFILRVRSALARPGWRLGVIAAGVLVLALLGFFVAWLRWGRVDTAATDGGPAPVIAVLPFANLSGDPARDMACVGLPILLAGNLASVRSLSVVPPQGTKEYATAGRDLRKIANDLGADLLVDGVFQSASAGILVTVNLLRASSNNMLWSQSFTGTADDLYKLQQRIAPGLLRALQAKASESERARALALPTANEKALALYAQGRTVLEREDIPDSADRAIRLFQGAVEQDPKFGLAYAGLGQGYLLKFRRTREPEWLDWAREAMNDALRLAPDRAEVRATMSVVLDATGRYEEAGDEARRAIALQPNSDEAHRLLADVLKRLKRGQEAVAEYQEAIRIRPGYWRNHASLAVTLLEQGRIDEAVDSFRRVTEIQPDSAWGFQQLGTAFHARGDLDAALTNYAKAIERGASARAHSNIGMIHYTRRNFEEAAHAFEQALTLDSKNARTWRNLGDTYLRIGRPEDSRKSYGQAVRLTAAQLAINPRDASLLALQGLCEAKLGRHADADRDLRRALELRPDDSDVVYKMAVAQALAGRNSEALISLKQALDLKYPTYVAQTDDDLNSLRNTAEYKRLMDGWR